MLNQRQEKNHKIDVIGMDVHENAEFAEEFTMRMRKMDDSIDFPRVFVNWLMN